jgi:hypothetical protein
MRRRRFAALWLCLAAAGCASAARITITQPNLIGAERRISVASDEAWFSHDDGGAAAAYLVDLPLPGSRQGRQYSLYLRLEDRPGDHTIGQPLSSSGFAAGIFHQLAGRRKGLTEFVAGDVTVEFVGLSGGAQRHCTLDLRCGDGTRLVGRFTARRDARRVRQYELISPSVQALIQPQTETPVEAHADSPPTSQPDAPDAAAPTAP